MPHITVESLGKDEDAYVKDLAETYVNVDFLDFQDTLPVREMAKMLLRYHERLTAKPDADKPKKVGLGLR